MADWSCSDCGWEGTDPLRIKEDFGGFTQEFYECPLCRGPVHEIVGEDEEVTYSEYERLEKERRVNDAVNHPGHYTKGSVECIEAIDSAVTGLGGAEAVYVAQVVKYIWRFKNKNGVEDLRKAKWYLERLITLEERQEAKRDGTLK